MTPGTDMLAASNAKMKPGTKRGRERGTVLGPESGARQIVVEQRCAQAVALRLQGASLIEIAEELGYADASGAYRAICAALREMLPDESRTEARRREIATLDRIQFAASSAAFAGDAKAQQVVIRCVMTRARWTPSPRVASVGA